MLGPADGDSRLDPHGHAVVAAEGGALGSLLGIGQACGQAGSGLMGGLYRSILVLLLSSLVGAFGLSPATLPARELSQVLDIFASIFEGAPCLLSVLVHQWHALLDAELLIHASAGRVLMDMLCAKLVLH